MNYKTENEDYGSYVLIYAGRSLIRLPKSFTAPIERATDDEAGQLAMLDAMDETRSTWQ